MRRGPSMVAPAPVPPTAQAAEHKGRYVAAAIAARLVEQEAPPFHYRPLGHMALLGYRTGVSRIGPLPLTGWPAWLVWHGYYLSHLPSWRHRLRVATAWLLSGVTGRETAQIPLGQGAAPPSRDKGEGSGGAGRRARRRPVSIGLCELFWVPVIAQPGLKIAPDCLRVSRTAMARRPFSCPVVSGTDMSNC